MPDANAEIELKFLVPATQRAALAGALSERGTAQRLSLVAAYLDTPDQRLAHAGLAWRVRREGRRWVQALKMAKGSLERFEHEVPRPDATPDPSAHAGTGPGDQLIELLHKAGQPVGERFRTEVRRLARRVRTRGAVVDIAFDEGRLKAGDAVQKICEVEFELVSGSVLAMLDLAERWRQRFGLVLDPRSKAERGHALAAGSPHPPVRKARLPRYGKHASTAEALGAVVDECLDQLGRNAIGLAEGDPDCRSDHVHQLRVAFRRLRSAVRAFRGWVAEPPAELVDGLRPLFAALGAARDREVVGGAIVAELAAAGAPPLPPPAAGEPVDLAALVRSNEVQRLLLGWLRWRTALQGDAEGESLKRLAHRRLRRWHRHLQAQAHAFDELDEHALHDLRKRIKRQRYVLGFFAPLLPHKVLARHKQMLAAAQQSLGEFNDLFVARAAYRGRVAAEPAAWFAVGWLTARIVDTREQARDDVRRLGGLAPPGR